MHHYQQLMGIWVGHLVTLEGKLQCLDIGIDSRLPKTVFNWDIDLGITNSLSKDIEGLFIKLDLSEKFINRQPFPINSVLALLQEFRR